MTGPWDWPKGNSVSPRPSVFPRGESEGNIEVEGKQNWQFPAGPVFNVFCHTSQRKTRKNCEEIVCLTPAGS